MIQHDLSIIFLTCVQTLNTSMGVGHLAQTEGCILMDHEALRRSVWHGFKCVSDGAELCAGGRR